MAVTKKGKTVPWKNSACLSKQLKPKTTSQGSDTSFGIQILGFVLMSFVLLLFEKRETVGLEGDYSSVLIMLNYIYFFC
ncbi:hypothetical protein PRUPE_4G277500 [Prunus persica]|uniref:Uncharacterized protein n=1 Tax=Prunus persica TaxID=3760 RepID=A0A251PTG2_PRUPE|nr:hypothetical protein PRUPE_4G277500 [Prunus persica]